MEIIFDPHRYEYWECLRRGNDPRRIPEEYDSHAIKDQTGFSNLPKQPQTIQMQRCDNRRFRKQCDFIGEY
jgi:hypothetical protein